MRFWATDPARSFAISYQKLERVQSEVQYDITDADIVLQLHSSRRVQIYLLQGLSDNIVWLVFALLGCFDGGSFVEVASVFDVQALEGIGELEDLVLRELRKLPAQLLDPRIYNDIPYQTELCIPL